MAEGSSDQFCILVIGHSFHTVLQGRVWREAAGRNMGFMHGISTLGSFVHALYVSVLLDGTMPATCIFFSMHAIFSPRT